MAKDSESIKAIKWLKEEGRYHSEEKYFLEQCKLVEDDVLALDIIKRAPRSVIAEIFIYKTWKDWCRDFVPDRSNAGIRSKKEFELLKKVFNCSAKKKCF